MAPWPIPAREWMTPFMAVDTARAINQGRINAPPTSPRTVAIYGVRVELGAPAISVISPVKYQHRFANE